MAVNVSEAGLSVCNFEPSFRKMESCISAHIAEHPTDPNRLLRVYAADEFMLVFDKLDSAFSELRQFDIRVPDFSICSLQIDERELIIVDVEYVPLSGFEGQIVKYEQRKLPSDERKALGSSASRLCSSLTKYLSFKASNGGDVAYDIFRYEQYLVGEPAVLIDLDPMITSLNYEDGSIHTEDLFGCLEGVSEMIAEGEEIAGISFPARVEAITLFDQIVKQNEIDETDDYPSYVRHLLNGSASTGN